MAWSYYQKSSRINYIKEKGKEINKKDLTGWAPLGLINVDTKLALPRTCA
jgi:hypothetical protein